jgi:hypothetical protein
MFNSHSFAGWQNVFLLCLILAMFDILIHFALIFCGLALRPQNTPLPQGPRFKRW